MNFFFFKLGTHFPYGSPKVASDRPKITGQRLRIGALRQRKCKLVWGVCSRPQNKHCARAHQKIVKCLVHRQPNLGQDKAGRKR